MMTAVVLAWVFMAMPGEKVGRFVYIALHKSIGQTVFFITLFRLTWRRFHLAPPTRGRIAAWEAVIARVNHWLLYAIMIFMPGTGYILATAAASPSPYFWLFYWPQPAVSTMVAHVALRAHLAGQYLLYILVGLHVAAVAWHVAVRRDGTLERMLPVQHGLGNGTAAWPGEKGLGPENFQSPMWHPSVYL
jgi:cytochrome b561